LPSIRVARPFSSSGATRLETSASTTAMLPIADRLYDEHLAELAKEANDG
jgi:hypothetical protein